MKLGRIGILLAMGGALIGGTIQAQDELVLVVGHAESTDSLDPARGYTQTTGIVNKLTYQNLVTFPDADASEIIPQLATDWTISEDGLTYTFNLAEGVVFSNGEAFTASDVVFSIQRLANVGGSPSFLTENIVSVEATDDSTVVFTLSSVTPQFLANLTANPFNIYDAETVIANGGSDAEDAATADTAEAYLNSTSVGSGPYVLESWEPQVETVLVRNENYAGEAPYYDRIIITNIAEPSTQLVALQGGEIHIALDLTSDQLLGLDPAGPISVYSGLGNIVHFLLMNQDEEIAGPVSNPLVQLAIRYALDYEGYQVLWGGVSPVSTMAYGVATSLDPSQALTRDLDRARELLAEAGYPDGFEITLHYPIFSFQGVNMDTNAQKLQSDLAEVGINVTLAPAELQVALEGYRSGTQGFSYWFWGPDYLDPIDQLSFLPDGKVGGERANWTSENADEAILALRDAAAVATNEAERDEVFAEIQLYLQQNGPWAPFIQPNVQIAYNSAVTGIVWHPQWVIDLALIHVTE